MKKILLIILLLCFILNIQAFGEDEDDIIDLNPLDLTYEELSFLNNHTTIRVANDLDFAPFNYYENGEPTGLVIDYMEEISQILNVKFEYVSGYLWEDMLGMFENKEIDIMPNLIKTDERSEYTIFSKGYLNNEQCLAIREDNEEIQSLSDLSNKTLVVISGYYTLDIIRDSYPQIGILEVPDYISAIEAVSNNRADAFFCNPTVLEYELKNKKIDNIVYIDSYFHKASDTGVGRIGIRKEWDLFKGIIDKAIDYMSLTKKQELADKYGLGVDVFYSENHFSDDEIKWLSEHPVIRVSNSMDFYPFDYVEGNEAAGLSVDTLLLISEIIGVELEFVNGYTWDELLTMLENKEIDLIHACQRTDERESYAAFIEPYIQLKAGLFQTGGINKFDDLSGKTMSVVKGYSVIDSFKKYYPEMDLLTFSSENEALDAVVNGEADAYYSSFDAMSPKLKMDQYKTLQFVEAYILEDVESSYQTIGIRKDWIILKDILDKAMKLISVSEKQMIADKYELDVNVFYDVNRLNDFEVDWLSKKPIINIIIADDYLPFSDFKNGEADGMVGDIIAEFEKRLNVEFNVKTGDAKSAIYDIENENVDVIGSIVITDKRKESLLFTEPFFSIPVVIFSNDKYSYAEDRDLTNIKVMTVENQAVNEFLRNDYPDLEIVHVKSNKEAISRINNGERAVFIGELTATNQVIDDYDYDNVGVVGYTNYNYNIAFAVNDDNQILASILNKTLNNIFTENGDSIQQKWLKTKGVIEYRKVIYVISFIVLFAIYLYVRMERHRRNELEKEVHLNLIDNQVLFVDIDNDNDTLQLSSALTDLIHINDVSNYSKNLIRFKELIKEEVKLDSGNSEVSNILKTDQGLSLEYIISEKSLLKNGYKVIFHDVTDKLKLKELSVRDEMTGLFNKRHFNNVFHEEINRARRDNNISAFALLDLDKFKQYNDTYGHSLGDDVLIEVARMMMKTFNRASDILFRLGGEEFGVLCSEKDVDKIITHFDKLRKEIENLNIPHEKNLGYHVVTTCIGIRIIDIEEGISKNAIYKDADKALYRAKDKGRNCIIAYSDEMDRV